MSETDLDIRDKVREHYAGVAGGKTSCCSDDKSCDCGVSERIGYSAEDLASLPNEAEMGLGAGTRYRLRRSKPEKSFWI
jgi:arsenite methyltransferase